MYIHYVCTLAEKVVKMAKAYEKLLRNQEKIIKILEKISKNQQKLTKKRQKCSEKEQKLRQIYAIFANYPYETISRIGALKRIYPSIFKRKANAIAILTQLIDNEFFLDINGIRLEIDHGKFKKELMQKKVSLCV